MNTIHNIVRGICIKNEKILLAYFKKGGYYFLPGGHIENGESMLHSLKREFREEMNMHIKPIELLKIFEHTWTNKNKRHHEINFIFSIELSKEYAIRSQVAHLEFQWVPLKKIKKINFLPKEVIKIITDNKRKKRGCFVTTFKHRK